MLCYEVYMCSFFICVIGSKTNFNKWVNKVYSIHPTHLGFGCALFAVTGEVVDVSEFLDPVLCRVQQVYVAGVYLQTQRKHTESCQSLKLNDKDTCRV